SVAMLTLHGAVSLSGKTIGLVQERAQRAALGAGVTTAILFAIGGLWARSLDGYVITSMIDPNGPSNPLAKQIARQAGALFVNYGLMPITMLVPVLGLVGVIGAGLLARSGRAPRLAWFISAVGIAGIIGAAGVSLFPLLLPSSLEPNSSLAVWDASSSKLTLGVMTAVTAILLPIVIVYTSWVYRVLRGPVTAKQISTDSHSY
ncbi:MAG TPA: cytochrome d ubiquinol oxidase subunit II, partial [Dongiaceae bacterium]